MALNNHQEKAVKSVGNTLVTACPGSGKTTVMSHKAARLLSKASGNLIAVTFTKDAAMELKHRIIKQASEENKHRVGAGTFHSLCMIMCKQAGIKFDLIDEQQRLFIFKKLSSMSGGTYSSVEVQGLIDGFRCVTERPIKKEHLSLLESYEQELKRYRKSDFQDIITTAVNGLKQGTIEPLNAKWFLVDEVQDMDDWQLEWVLAHAKKGIHCTLVGDDDQSIYGFRGSLGYGGMMKFAREMRAQQLTLPINYRCREEILNPASKLIENNHDRVFKEINAGRGKGGEIDIESHLTRSQEVETIVRERLKKGQGEWGVLARTNSLLDEVELELNRHSIAYKRIGGESFWQSPIALLYLSILKNLIKPNWLSVQHLLFRLKVDYDALEHAHSIEEVSNKLRSNSKGKEAVEEFRKQVSRWRALSNKDEEQAIESVTKEIASYIKKHYPKNKEGGSAADVLIKAAIIMCKFDGHLWQRIRSIEMLKDNEEGASRITLMTMHASKGLEFEKIWILACEQGEIPSNDSPLEEERRLFYVAMTRAKDYLLMSRSQMKVSDKGEFEIQESQFLSELD